MRTKDFFGMHGGDKHQTREDMMKLIENWDNLSDIEKLNMMDARVNAFKEHKEKHKNFFTVEGFDQKCAEWMAKTPDEKAIYVDELKKHAEEHHAHFGGRFGHCR